MYFTQSLNLFEIYVVLELFQKACFKRILAMYTHIEFWSPKYLKKFNILVYHLTEDILPSKHYKMLNFWFNLQMRLLFKPFNLGGLNVMPFHMISCFMLHMFS